MSPLPGVNVEVKEGSCSEVLLQLLLQPWNLGAHQTPVALRQGPSQEAGDNTSVFCSASLQGRRLPGYWRRQEAQQPHLLGWALSRSQLGNKVGPLAAGLPGRVTSQGPSVDQGSKS